VVNRLLVMSYDIRLCDLNLNNTISARPRRTAVTINADTPNAITHPAEPEMLINCPEMMKMPMPTVPENAIPEEQIRTG
jgi:hypothetical protein